MENRSGVLSGGLKHVHDFAPMQLIPCGSVATIAAPEAYFTGRVTLTQVIETPEPARLRAAMVSFEPGARTAWHTHPLGQTLHVVSGAGLVQVWGEPIREIRAAELRRHAFAAGSMGPKVGAACDYVERTGQRASIGALSQAEAVASFQSGTLIAP